LLITLFTILLTIWLVAVITGSHMGGYIHVLLLLALLSLIFEVVTGGKHVQAILRGGIEKWTTRRSRAKSMTSKAA
jgi:hypothetical protein